MGDNSAGVPNDLMTLRRANAELQIRHQTLLDWIRRGRYGFKLSTYREPDDPHTVRVSAAEVLRIAAVKPPAEKKIGVGKLGVDFDEESADEIREYAKLVSEKLGLPKMACKQAILLAVKTQLREVRQLHG